MFVLHEPLLIKPKCRVELHIHLDGAIRPETIWEIMRKKSMLLPGDGSLASLKHALTVREPEDLLFFLKAFSIFLPAFQGDLEAIERFSYEFVEDQSEQSIAYCEARLCPHLLLPDTATVVTLLNGESLQGCEEPPDTNGRSLLVNGIVEAALRGLKKGEEKYGTKVRLILCCIRGKNEWSRDILRLCEEYRNEGVVGIDIAGNHECANESLDAEEVLVFEAAKEKGIRRTIHAGEEAGWESVKHAITVLGAERIGHGYRVIENEEFYQKCLQDRVHFEMCPHSSYLTGSIKHLNLPSKRHPILRLAEDGASFSINSDDPTVTGTHVGEEYELLRKWGFTEAIFARANFEAAARSFLPSEEKEALLSNLRTAYGVVYEDPSARSSHPGPTESLVSIKKPAVNIASWEDRKF